MEKMKLNLEGQLNMRYESKTKGMEKVITENERLRKELKKVWSLQCIPLFPLATGCGKCVVFYFLMVDVEWTLF